VLEFEADLDGLYVQGVDMLRWNDEGKLGQCHGHGAPAAGAAKAGRADGTSTGRWPGLSVLARVVAVVWLLLLR
jgi:hypothetical protein